MLPFSIIHAKISLQNLEEKRNDKGLPGHDMQALTIGMPIY